MDTIVLNVSHSQLEEQLKIAAACGVAEQNKAKNDGGKEGENIEIEVDMDEDNELAVDDANEGVHDHSMTSSSSDHDDRSSPDSLPPSTTSSTQQILGDEFVKTLEKISKQQSSTLAAATTESSAGAHTSHGAGNYRTELKRPDLKGTFRCSICQKIFCHSSSLSRHRMQAHFKSYTCTLCRKEITSNETLRAHMYKQHQISRMFMCRCCNWAFPDKTSLHMHMQAKEEGKTISVPVIGKGNPPTPQQHNQSSSHHTSSNQVVTQQLHNPHAAARPLASTPSNSFFNPLQIHPLPAHQPLSIADPNALQTAAATLFPQMALLRGTTSTPTATSNSAATTAGAQTDELMMKLRERLMLNNLMAQSGFGLAAWLAALPKVDQSGIGNLNTTNGDIMNGKEMNNVEMGEEDDEINVDKEIEEQEMRLDRERQNDDDIQTDDSGDGMNKRSDKESHSQMNDANDSEENKNSENAQRPRSMKKSTSDDSSSPSNGISSSISNTMPNLRSAIATSPLNSLIYKKRLLHSPSTLSDTLLNIAATQATLPASDQSSDGQDSHVSPTETHSSLSPATESGRECFECSVYKGKLAVAENRCRYLEGRTATLQSDALRFSTRVSASESSARQFEQEGRLLREQNELLQRKLLECQEKTLAFMQGDQVANPQAVAFYLNEILKATLLC